MGVPDFLGPARPLAAAPPAAPAAAPPLNIRLEQQALSNWCWAAVTSAVQFFYREAYAVEQCAVATRCLMVKCCPPGPNTPDTMYNLITALGQNAAPGAVNGQISFDDFKREIAGGRPVCCVVDWDSGGSHVLLGAGYTDGGDIWVDDPAAPGLRALPWSSFSQLYSGDGHWRQTVKTKRWGA